MCGTHVSSLGSAMCCDVEYQILRYCMIQIQRCWPQDTSRPADSYCRVRGPRTFSEIRNYIRGSFIKSWLNGRSHNWCWCLRRHYVIMTFVIYQSTRLDFGSWARAPRT
jgi:hypothetical protein